MFHKKLWKSIDNLKGDVFRLSSDLSRLQYQIKEKELSERCKSLGLELKDSCKQYGFFNLYLSIVKDEDTLFIQYKELTIEQLKCFNEFLDGYENGLNKTSNKEKKK